MAHFFDLEDVDMELRDNIGDTFFSTDMADLDFAILQDDFVNDFNLLDDICLPDDCHSNSNSFSSEVYLDHQSSSSSPFNDSPPLTPPSQGSDSDGGSVSSPPSRQIDVKVKSEPNNNMLTQQAIQLPLLMKSSRGRSASHDSPDVQAMKRHIRMIRNRESACLSRKKKKDHVTSLESRISELERENAQLKQENAILKSRLDGAKQQIPMTMPAKIYSNSNNGVTKSKANIPKTSAVVKIALLGLCCFVFVSFRSPNQYNPTSTLTQHSLNHTSKMMRNSDIAQNSFLNLQEAPAPSSDVTAPPNFLRSRRSFGLWDTNTEVSKEDVGHNETRITYTKESLQNMTRKLDANTSRGHFHNPRSFRNLTFTAPPPPANECPMPFNKTEALRVQNDLKGIFGKRVGGKKRTPTKPLVYSLIDLEMQNIENKGLTIYNEKMRRFSSVLDQLQQREDTFYVVSLAFENQLLLSAKAHNASSRPKMSFVMPWKNETHGGKEEIMQIDCEVTRVVSLKNNNRRKRN